VQRTAIGLEIPPYLIVTSLVRLRYCTRTSVCHWYSQPHKILGKGKVEVNVNVKFILGEATSELDGVACQRQAMDILPPRKTRHPLYKRLGGSQGRTGRVRKISPQPGFVACQRQSTDILPPGKTRYPLYKRLGGPQGRTGRMRKILPQPGFDPRTVQPVASRYTDCANPAFKLTRP
jgi:hypothetical protein